MNIEELKQTYKNAGKPEKTREQIKMMTGIKNHSTLKGLRRQLIVETLFFGLFLFFYYDFFDGHLKPVFWNILLVASVILILFHNILGFIAAKNPIAGDDVKQSLKNYLNKLKRYSIVSIFSRAFGITAIMVFFISTVTFEEGKYFILIGIGLIIIVQVYMLKHIWLRRIKELHDIIEEFDQD